MAVEIEELAARANKAQDAANRAHWRLLAGATHHSAAMYRLQGKADEAWEQLRAHKDYDPDLHGRQEYATEVAEREDREKEAAAASGAGDR